MVKKEHFRLEILDEVKEGEHFHQNVELIYVLEGAMDVDIEGRVSRLKDGDVCVINANRKHAYRNTRGLFWLRLLINYKLVTENSDIGEAIFWCDSSTLDSDKYERLRKLLRAMLQHYIENREYEESLGYLADCYGILDYLIAHFMLRVGDMRKSDEGDRYEDRLRQIDNYIYNNYDQPISMKDLSEKLYLSNGYLSRFFKKNYGMSFAGYLTNVRTLHAADDLLYSDEPITRIAYNNGFTSAALFNKVFKKVYGQTPSEFRKRALKNAENSDPAHQQELEKRLEQMLEKKLLPEEAEREVLEAGGEFSVQFYDALKSTWGHTINFGDAANLLHSAVREHLSLLHNSLGFEYVRFWGLFTEEFFISPNQEAWNFGQIDSVLDYILELGMKPHIELGLKPRMILYTVGNTKEHKQISMDDYTTERWEELMQAFMRHLSKRYGQNLLDDWRFELWFDESWRVNADLNGNTDRYLQLFRVTRQAIKKCNDRIQVGGYGIRMDIGHEKRLQILKKWNDSSYRPDFLSVGFYAYERREDGIDRFAKRNTDNEALLHLLTREKALMTEAGMWDLPLYLTEWNLTPSVRNYVNDTTFKGAYIIKNMLDIYGKVSDAAYGAGSDLQYASYDTPELLFGGTGLLTKDTVMKPAAFAFNFLSRLFPYYIGHDGNCLITSDLHDNYAIVCHNQQILNYNYYLTAETEMERSAMWKYYEGRKTLHLRIKLEGVTNGTYRVKVYRINDQLGSVMKIWDDLGYEEELSRNDLHYIRRASQPNMMIQKMESRDGELLIEENLLPNEITLMRIFYGA